MAGRANGGPAGRQRARFLSARCFPRADDSVKVRDGRKWRAAWTASDMA